MPIHPLPPSGDGSPASADPHDSQISAVGPPAGGKPRLLDRVRREIRVRHYSIRTESSYVDWIKRFIIFNERRHPSELGASEVTAFLTHLAVERSVAVEVHKPCEPCPQTVRAAKRSKSLIRKAFPTV